MKNSEFRLLSESLGFYSAKNIVKYLNQLENFQTLNERAVDYWLKGKKTIVDAVPTSVNVIFTDLQNLQASLVEQERKNIATGDKQYFKYVYKTESLMWGNYPELQGLPVSFLNQIIIRLGLNLDYYENHELNIT